jgi:hypothetical protein
MQVDIMRRFYPPNLMSTCGECGRVLKPAEEQKGTCSGCGATFSPLLTGLRVACVRCGYDLRGTPDHCPECGLSVDATMARLSTTAYRRAAVKRVVSPKSDTFRFVWTWLWAGGSIIVGLILLGLALDWVAKMFWYYDFLSRQGK